jgi:hypothetical protein
MVTATVAAKVSYFLMQCVYPGLSIITTTTTTTMQFVL